MRILHLSDPHFGAIHIPALQALKDAVAELKPELIILTGDITQRARSSQFAEAKQYFSQFAPIPVLATPGNHDIPLYNIFTRWLTPYRKYSKYFSEQLYSHIYRYDTEVLVLNSSMPKHHVDGEFNLEELESYLQKFDSKSKVRMLAFHHPMDCPKGVDRKNIIVHSEAILKLCETYGVDIILNGHIHDPLARLSSVRYPHIKHPVILTLAGTCLSYRIRPNAPNSFNCIDITVDSESNRKEIKVSRYDMQADAKFQIKWSEVFHKNSTDVWQHDEIKSPNS